MNELDPERDRSLTIRRANGGLEMSEQVTNELLMGLFAVPPNLLTERLVRYRIVVQLFYEGAARL
jgi:hypothetical protein